MVCIAASPSETQDRWREQAVQRQHKKAKLDVDDSSEKSNIAAQRRPIATTRQATDEDYLNGCTFSRDEPPLLTNHTVLYKAKSAADLRDPDQDLLISSNGNINFKALLTSAGGLS